MWYKSMWYRKSIEPEAGYVGESKYVLKKLPDVITPIGRTVSE